MPLRNLVAIMLAAVLSLACYEKASRNRYAAVVASAMQTIEDNYFEEVEPRELFERAMEGMVSGLDEYSDYIPPKLYLQFQQSIEQEFVGIGIVVDGPPNIERITVVSPVYDSPAYRAGVRAGDVILRIDGESTEGRILTDCVDAIKGLQGTTVELLVQHMGDEDPVSLKIRRDVIRTRSVLGDTRGEAGRWNYYLQQHPDIGYVRITTFGEHTIEELEEVLRFEDHPVKSLILDLRGNAGGLLSAAVDTCDMFLDEGVIVSTRGRGGSEQRTFSARSGVIVDRRLPVVVLVDRFSASASEIVAACLQDYGRAKVVGQRTWGKGTVQNIIPLESGRSALKLTTASYWRPSGKNIHRGREDTEQHDWGVRPDEGLQVMLTDEQYRDLFEQRRQRDILFNGGDPVDDPPPIDDEQLNRAIEAVRQQIPQPPAVTGVHR